MKYSSIRLRTETLARLRECQVNIKAHLLRVKHAEKNADNLKCDSLDDCLNILLDQRERHGLRAKHARANNRRRKLEAALEECNRRETRSFPPVNSCNNSPAGDDVASPQLGDRVDEPLRERMP